MILKHFCFHVRYFAVLIFAVNFGSIGCGDALLFDAKDAKLVQKPLIRDEEIKNICENCAAACPSTTAEDFQYNYEESFGKKVLFVKNVYDATKEINEIQVPECDGIIEPSVVLNVSNGLLETGYEVHDRKNIIQFSSSNGEPDKLFSLYPSDIEQTPNPMDILLKYFESGKKLPPPKENSMNFIWLPVLTIKFNLDTLSPKQLEYHPDVGVHWWGENCKMFDIGKEFYPDNSLASFYARENQRKIFTGVENQPDQTSKTEELECEPKYGCLIQHQIIPSYYSHSYYGKIAICTFFNTIPVWESIANRINIVDRYLYAMTQLWQPNINIVNGFFGVFAPSAKHFKKIPVPDQPLYLDQLNNNISVPLVIYKTVEYKVQTRRPENSVNHLFALIVIHNDPTSDAGTIRVCQGDDRLQGWEDIENEDPGSGLVYVCRFSAGIAENLRLAGKENARDADGFRLDEFHTYDAERNDYVYHNAKLMIKEKIKELFRHVMLKIQQ